MSTGKINETLCSDWQHIGGHKLATYAKSGDVIQVKTEVASTFFFPQHSSDILRHQPITWPPHVFLRFLFNANNERKTIALSFHCMSTIANLSTKNWMCVRTWWQNTGGDWADLLSHSRYSDWLQPGHLGLRLPVCARGDISRTLSSCGYNV